MLDTNAITLTDEQELAVKRALECRVSILTGGPGVGKTTVCNEIIRQAAMKGWTCALCAPSGKAAKRMQEATGHSALTIHKLLEATVDPNGDFIFKRNEFDPIEADLVICDETSMVTNNLLADLLRAIDERKTRILFVGDQNQLPSVGCGAVLRDMITSGTISCTELTKIHRNSGSIVRACHMIKHGKTYEPDKVMDLDKGANLVHIETYDQEAILEVIETLVSKNLPARGYDPFWDIQVISPTNSRTALSCESLNARLQKVLNPYVVGNHTEQDKPSTEPVFYKGDKAIQIKNQRVGESGYVVNGDICQIMDVFKSDLTVKFFDPERTFTVKRYELDLLLAYAITCHRFQGSEAPVIIIPVHRAFTFFLERPWIYTAISRAKELCITVGQRLAIDKAIKRVESVRRVTKLEEKLREFAAL